MHVTRQTDLHDFLFQYQISNQRPLEIFFYSKRVSEGSYNAHAAATVPYCSRPCHYETRINPQLGSSRVNSLHMSNSTNGMICSVEFDFQSYSRLLRIHWRTQQLPIRRCMARSMCPQYTGITHLYSRLYFRGMVLLVLRLTITVMFTSAHLRLIFMMIAFFVCFSNCWCPRTR